MSLTERHHPREYAGVLESHGINDTIEHKGLFKPANLWFDGDRMIIKDLVLKYDTPHMFLTFAAIYMIAIVGVIIFDETGLIPLPRMRAHDNFYYQYLGGALPYYGFILGVLLGIKYLAHARYLVIEEGWAYLYTKKRGVWGYPVEDLKFHIIRSDSEIPPTHLEIELPEPSFKDDEKMVVVEIAARKEAIDGTLAVLLPLLKGDKKPYSMAQKRRYMSIPPEKKKNWFYDHFNFTNHIFTWFLVYRYNDFIFWLVHGSRQKLLRKNS